MPNLGIASLSSPEIYVPSDMVMMEQFDLVVIGAGRYLHTQNVSSE